MPSYFGAPYFGPTSTSTATVASFATGRTGGSVILQGYAGDGSSAADRSRSYDVLTEIRRLLESTAAFASVRLHGPDEYEEDGQDHEVLAFIEEVSWEEDSDADDATTVRERRDVTWRLIIDVKDPDPIRRYHRLSLLAETAANTLNGVSYLGQTVAGLSRLTRAAFSEPNHPYRQVQIEGKFTILPEGYDGHDAYAADVNLIL